MEEALMADLRPLYLAELILSVIAVGLGVYTHARRMPGWLQVPIILPWLFLKIVFAAGLLLGLLRPSYLETYVLLIAGPASIALLFTVRIVQWKRG